MILLSDEDCKNVIAEMANMDELNAFERSFVDSNIGRQTFSDRQKEIVSEFAEKYDFDCLR
jgi:hypothetical protein